MDYLIKLSPDNVAINNKSLEDERATAVKEGMTNPKQIQSKREIEKGFLQNLLQKALEKKATIPAAFTEICTISADIRDCADKVKIDATCFEKYIKDSLGELKEEEKAKMPWMMFLLELFKQISSPEEVKTKEAK